MAVRLHAFISSRVTLVAHTLVRFWLFRLCSSGSFVYMRCQNHRSCLIFLVCCLPSASASSKATARRPRDDAEAAGSARSTSAQNNVQPVQTKVTDKTTPHNLSRSDITQSTNRRRHDSDSHRTSRGSRGLWPDDTGPSSDEDSELIFEGEDTRHFDESFPMMEHRKHAPFE